MEKIKLTEKSVQALKDKSISNLKKFKFLGVDVDGMLCLFEARPHYVKGENCNKQINSDMWIYSGTNSVCQIHPDTKLADCAGSLFEVIDVQNNIIMIGV